MDDISPKLQNQIAQFQAAAATAAGGAAARSSEWKPSSGGADDRGGTQQVPEDVTLYKNVGSLADQGVGQGVLLKELEDDKETSEVRVKTLDRQEKIPPREVPDHAGTDQQGPRREGRARTEGLNLPTDPFIRS